MPLNLIRLLARPIAAYDLISLPIFQTLPTPRLGMLSFHIACYSYTFSSTPEGTCLLLIQPLFNTHTRLQVVRLVSLSELPHSVTYYYSILKNVEVLSSFVGTNIRNIFDNTKLSAKLF